MKQNRTIFWVFIILIVAGAIIWLMIEDNDEQSASPESQKHNSILDRLSNRIKAIEEELNAQRRALSLTTEMAAFVEHKIERTIFFFKMVFGVIFLLSVGWLWLNGFDLIMALLTISGVVCVMVPISTFFFFKKVMDVQGLIAYIFCQIKIWIFKKYGCDVASIQAIQDSVNAKQEVIKIIREEIRSIKV